MSEYTSITTDMRMLMGCFTGFTEFERDKFERLCDSIDAIHANLERENENLRRGLDHVMGEQDHDGWVELPKDADGVPIHVGDEMEFSAFEVEKPVTRMVDGIGQGVFFAWCGERGYQQHEAKRYCHHHEPTVEDVLREFAERYLDYEGIPSVGRRGVGEALMDEYASKLRLAGE